jgi:hypothetical protein
MARISPRISQCIVPAEPDMQSMTALEVSESLAIHLELLTRQAEEAARAEDWASVQLLVKEALATAITTAKQLRESSKRLTGRQTH